MASDEPLTAEQIIRQVSYWLDLADYDIETARAMHSSQRLLYVAFMCHQVIEKALKGVYAERCQSIPPKIHSLVALAQNSGVYGEMTPTQQEFLIAMNHMNIEGRYPIDKDRLLAELTVSRCERMIFETEELLQWIKQKLSSA